MRSSRLAWLASAISGISLLFACSTADEGDASAGADLSSSAPPATAPDKVAMLTKLSAVWVPKDAAATDYQAIQIRARGLEIADGDRDVKHAILVDPKNGKDAADADRHPLSITLLTATDATHGTIDFSYTEFQAENAKIGLVTQANRHETYNYELTGSAPNDTLVLTETAETRVDFSRKLITDPTQQVDPKKHPLRGRTELVRAPSYCATLISMTDLQPGNRDCRSRMSEKTFTPATPGCEGNNAFKCTTCQNHRCGVRKVSSCEAAGNNLCTSTAAECEVTTPSGELKLGTVVTKDAKGKPIDCNGSPSGRTVCCEIAFGDTRFEGHDPAQED